MTPPKPAGKSPGCQATSCCCPLPSIVEKYRQRWCPKASRQMPGCPQDHTGQHRLTVLGPGMEENSFPKKQFKKTWKISTTQVSAQTEWGWEVFYGRPAEDSSSSAKRQRRKETLSPQGSACTPDTFCTDDAGKSHLPHRQWFRTWASPGAAPGTRVFLMDAGAAPASQG